MKIVKIELHSYEQETKDFIRDKTNNMVYQAGARSTQGGQIIRIVADSGAYGEFAGGSTAEYSTLPLLADYLLGRDPLERERIYSDMRRMLRQVARIGMAPIDIALWDLAGRHFNAPIYELFGKYRDKLPCYASTTHGSDTPGLDSPEAYAEFAAHCKELGYPAFKIHGKTDSPDINEEIATVLAVREAVGPEIDLMLDPACEYETFGQAVKVGRACDEADFFWYEDPYRDGGISQFAHRKLRELIRTPILQGEHVRSVEPRMDFVLADATDYVRGDPYYDGITGVMKLAHACEAIGLDIELHGPGPAQRQCMAALRNANYYEMGLVHPMLPGDKPSVLYKDHYHDGLNAIDSSGCVPVPTGPGLGVDIDWDWVSAHRTGQREWTL